MRKAIGFSGYLVFMLLILVSVVMANDLYHQYVPVIAGETGNLPQPTPTPSNGVVMEKGEANFEDLIISNLGAGKKQTGGRWT